MQANQNRNIYKVTVPKSKYTWYIMFVIFFELINVSLFSLAAKLIGPFPECEFFENVDFLREGPLNLELLY